ncbi:MAG TPA: ABC transporter ATP-binding protein [candidate division Zixibacteria bacterium]|nr:ABC transporter ATP-binding protein [candidate division Zixibacteria bacterium]
MMVKNQPQDTKKIIHCTNLSKVFQFGSEQIHALQNINLEITEGEYVAIMGKSGSGKTTLINILAGLLTASSGNVIINGQSLIGMSSDQLSFLRREIIGIVFQMFNLHPGLTVLENVELPLLFSDVEKNKRRAAAREILTFLQLEDYIDNFPEELSGGEKQRVAIARALINEPKILLADEPTGNLNSLLAKEIITLFKKINRERGLTIILVTHDESLIDDDMRLIKLKDGSLIN